MPIIISKNLNAGFEARLRKAGAITLSQEQAESQDIRPARIGILNLMPAATMQATEVQWLRYLSNTLLQIEPVFVKFDQDEREKGDSSRGKYLKDYVPFSAVKAMGLDGLIVTGDNLELTPDGSALLPFGDIRYADQLRKVMQWARANVYSTIYSCLASHFALHTFHGLERDPLTEKNFGVFTHKVAQNSNFTAGMDDYMRAPHARWGNVPTSKLKKCGIEVLAESKKAGWLLAEEPNQAGGFDLYIQGHPEYDRHDLQNEFLRDGGANFPASYFIGNNPTNPPKLNWANDAKTLHANWIGMLYKHFSSEI